MRRSHALPVLCLASLCGPPLAAQEENPPPVPSSTLLLRLRAAHCSLDMARETIHALHDRPWSTRRQAYQALLRHYRRGLDEFAKARDTILRRADRLVPRIQRRRLSGEGQQEVERLRKEARGITGAKDLTKERIRRELDPRLARLRELVLVDRDALLDEDPSLSDALDDLFDRGDDLLEWYDLSLDTHRDLVAAAPAGSTAAKRPAPAAPPDPEQVERDLDRACLMALPLSSGDREVLSRNRAVRDELDPEEYAGTLELNVLRIVLGLPTLRLDTKLCAAARDHSSDMKRLSFFSHTSPVEGKRTPAQRASRFGTSAQAENIAAGQDTGAEAIEAWWYSPGHHKNMLAPHARTGLGRCGRYWTQMFGN